LRFPGQYYDAETGKHYNYYRDYDPAIGRYIQSDPIGLKGGINTYAYADSNPLALVDSKGLQATSPTWPGWGALGRGLAGGARGMGAGIGGAALGFGLGMLMSCQPTPLERCERGCDADHDRRRDLCRALSGMRGRDKSFYRECIEKAEDDYIQCYQDCKRDNP
jgi:RHS repeat-associated protein